MLQNSTNKLIPLAAALMLAACSLSRQPAAPVVDGSGGSFNGNGFNSGMTAQDDNPYGVAPYQPDTAAAGGTTPYTPPPATYTPPAAAAPYIPSNAPVDINARTHTVVRGDTVYNIAKRYHISQDNLRAWNNLADNTISVGQVLNVKANGHAASHSSGGTTQNHTPQNTYTPPASDYTPPAENLEPEQPSVPSFSSSSASTRTVENITWQRPTEGKIISNFVPGKKESGIDIAGTAGQIIVAAADGRVGHAALGPRGYGNTVIIQHDSVFLSAYANVDTILVHKGDVVKRGQAIARMGSSESDRVKLHFEMRKGGKSVDPARYVPF